MDISSWGLVDIQEDPIREILSEICGVTQLVKFPRRPGDVHSDCELMQDIAVGELQLVELGADVEREYAQILGACYQQTPPIPLRTLDALHLASARVVGETELVATDKRMREAGKLLGFSLFPV